MADRSSDWHRGGKAPAAATAAVRPTIDSEADLRAGVGHLVARCPRLAAAYELTGLPPLRREAPGFASLVDIIVSQLVSLAAADAISMRLRTAVTPLDPAGVLTAGEARIRAAGLTGAKTRSVLALADAIVGGQLDFDRLATARRRAGARRTSCLPRRRPVDRRHLRHVLPWAARCVRARRSCIENGDVGAV